MTENRDNPFNSSTLSLDQTSSVSPGLCWRLFKHGQSVGFAKKVGPGSILYSRDGQKWTGSILDSDAEVPQIPDGFSSKMLFHGDVVRMPAHSGAQVSCEKVILLGPDKQVYLSDPTSSALHRLVELWPPPSRPRVNRVLGTVVGDSAAMRKLERAITNLSGHGVPSGVMLTLLVSAIFVGVGLSAFIQIVTLGHIGPLWAMGGGGAGALVFWWGLRRWDWHALRRKQMLVMSARAGLVLMVIGLFLFPLFNRVHGAGVAIERVLFQAGAGATLGFLLGLVCSILAADLVSWRTGGYAGEAYPEIGFRQ